MGLDDDVLSEIVKNPTPAERRMLELQPISYFMYAAHSLYMAENSGLRLGENKILKLRNELTQLTNEQVYRVIGLIDRMIEIYKEAVHTSSNSEYYAREIAVFNAVRRSLVERSFAVVEGGRFKMPPNLHKAASAGLYLMHKEVS